MRAAHPLAARCAGPSPAAHGCGGTTGRMGCWAASLGSACGTAGCSTVASCRDAGPSTRSCYQAGPAAAWPLRGSELHIHNLGGPPRSCCYCCCHCCWLPVSRPSNQSSLTDGPPLRLPCCCCCCCCRWRHPPPLLNVGDGHSEGGERAEHD